MSKYSTLTDLAKSLGVAPSTVSRALQDHPRISKKTKELIWQRVKESGFVPNRYSQILKDNKTYLIGVIVPDLKLHFFSRVLASINHTFASTEYAIVLGHSEETILKEAEIIDKFINLRVDGIIAALSKESGEVDHFERAIKQDIPLVFYDRVSNFLKASKVIADDYNAAYRATEHLIKTGCTVIAHITASKNLNNSNNRLYGYLDALKDNQIEVNEDLIFYFQFDHSSIHKFLDKTIRKYPQLDGIFVFNDYVANTAIHHLLKIGKRIPEDISVMGFSNEPISSYMTPQLSTVEDVAEQMGFEAANTMLKILSGEQLDDDKIVVNQELVLKGTTR